MNLDRKDYENIYDPNTSAGGKITANVSEPPIPDLAEILAAPEPPKIAATKLVSIAVTDDVPLKDVLIELARLADVDIEVDAGITGGVTFRAKDRPFNEVIERISDLAGLRYTMKDNVLRVERDTAYIQIYALDFLNIERSSDNSMTISTNVLSSSGGAGGGGGGSGGLNSGSNSSLTSKTTGDFWKQFEEGIKQIIAYKAPRRVSTAAVATQTPATANQPQRGRDGRPIPTPQGGQPGAAGGGAGGAGAGGAGAAPAPAATGGGAAAGGTGGAVEYTLNRQAATLTVSATDKQHQLIKRFIDKLQANSSSQVLIEAKIVEVALNDQFQSGIDWAKLGGSGIAITGNYGAVSNNDALTTIGIEKNGKSIDLSAAVQLAEIFGTTRTLSSPRLHATNNQQAVLTFAENQVYFTLQITQTQSANGTTAATGLNKTTVNSTIHTVPIGIILTLQPSINTDTNEVTLNVRPTLSRITGSVSDPAVTYLLASDTSLSGLDSKIPIVEVRELDSVLKIKSGQVMVIGGLMQDSSLNTDKGLPGVSSVPVFGNLFKGVDKSHSTKELVIFIRAVIVGSNGSADNADRTVYEKFTKDPRPLKF